MSELDEVRLSLRKLGRRLAEGEIDEATAVRQREFLLSGLTSSERAELGLTPTPAPAPPSPVSGVSGLGTPLPFSRSPLGPSGGRGRGIGTRVAALSDLDLQPGAVLFDKWRIERELGRGGFGMVVEAEELRLRKRQAVKVLDPAMVARADLLERFRREVNATRELVHARIVRVFDYDEDLSEGLAVFSMELVKGCSVQLLMTAARGEGVGVPVRLSLAVLAQVLEALEAAHAQGVVHRDVTPANILLAGGTAKELLADPSRDPQVKLVDFGISGALERSELSQKSRVLGTAAYVAPEVLDPRVDQVTPAADVYGAGAVFYEMLTGEAPLGVFDPPSSFRGDCDDDIDTLTLSLLYRQPLRRPEAGAAREAVADLLEGGARRREEERRSEDARRLEGERRRDEARRREGERERRERAAAEVAAEEAAERAEAEARARADEQRRAEEARRAGESEAERLHAARAESERRKKENERRLQESGFREIAPGHPWYPGAVHPEQTAEAERLGLPLAIEDAVTGIALVLIPGGSFEMGASPGDDEASEDEKPRHRVELRPFYAGVCPVLQEQWERVATANRDPSAAKGPRLPVESVSWVDVQELLSAANGPRTGAGLRLPTEAEWERAARGGTETRFWWGDDFRKGTANCRDGGPGGTTEARTSPPNPYGLLDMLGNVWEWCADWYDAAYYRTTPSKDPKGPASGSGRVLRGGSWLLDPSFLRVSVRGYSSPLGRNGYRGFRCVRDAAFP